jgi:NitT/TauT family transport system substrate-binding protein
MLRGWTMKRRVMTGITFALLIALLAWGIVLHLTPPETLPKATLITSQTSFSASVMLAMKRGWFTEAGVDVTVVQRSTGKGALAELSDGHGDFATAAETPVMFALLKSPSLKLIAGLGLGTDTTTIVGRKDRGIESSSSLPGHKVGFVPGTNSQYFLDIFLEYHDIRPGAVVRIPLKPEDMIAALLEGRVDVISTWAPLNYQALQALGDVGVELRVGSIYRWSWNLVARNELVANSPMAEGVLRALVRASEEIRDHPRECAKELAPLLGLPEDKTLDIWERTSFDVTLAQSMLLSLELQTRWAINGGLTDLKEVPNFLPAISAEALRKVDPALVTVIDGKGRP